MYKSIYTVPMNLQFTTKLQSAYAIQTEENGIGCDFLKLTCIFQVNVINVYIFQRSNSNNLHCNIIRTYASQ